MAGTSITEEAGSVTLTSSGGAVVNTAFSDAADVAAAYVATAAPFSLPAGKYHTLCDIVFTGTFASAPAANKVLYLYRRDKNISGASHAAIPTANNRNITLPPIPLGVGTTQYVKLPAVPLSKDCEFYIENGSGVTLNSGWTLTATAIGYNVTV